MFLATKLDFVPLELLLRRCFQTLAPILVTINNALNHIFNDDDHSKRPRRNVLIALLAILIFYGMSRVR